MQKETLSAPTMKELNVITTERSMELLQSGKVVVDVSYKQTQTIDFDSEDQVTNTYSSEIIWQ